MALKAAELSQDAPHRFLSVFERLSALQSKELEPLLYILNKVHTDPAVAAALDVKKKNLKQATPQKTPTSTPSSQKFRSTLGNSSVTIRDNCSLSRLLEPHRCCAKAILACLRQLLRGISMDLL